MCNKLIKFGCFRTAGRKEFRFYGDRAYATTIRQDGKTWLGTAKDPVKDQTDFLAPDRLPASFQTDVSYRRTDEAGSTRNRKQGRIAQCPKKGQSGNLLLGKINYNDFVRRFLGEREGAIIELETGKKVGTHRGYWFHTIGQRKGLGLSGGPWFVIKKDVEENIIYVSHGYGVETQFGSEFRINDFHFITENPVERCRERR